MKAYRAQYTLFDTESRLCEISVAIPVPEHIAFLARDLRKQAYSLTDRSAEPTPEVYIPVCSFLLFEHKAYDMYSHFMNELESVPDFLLHTAPVAAETSPESVYLPLEAGQPFGLMLKRINDARSELHIRTNYSQVSEPRIPLFRSSTPKEFQLVKGALIGSYTSGYFRCEQVHLIKFDLLNRTHTILGRIQLNNQLPAVTLSDSSGMNEDLFL